MHYFEIFVRLTYTNKAASVYSRYAIAVHSNSVPLFTSGEESTGEMEVCKYNSFLPNSDPTSQGRG